ncbi:MAG: HNH endonuclease signature motif containing protein [Desulfovibrionaceae bacterium]|nr:HNH endonuclease signature motif containing protein [Desulfovibrionaceae bacterium]
MKSSDATDGILNDENASEDNVLGFVSDVTIGAVSGVVGGAVRTAADMCRGISRLCTGDLNGAADIVVRRGQNMISGIINTAESGIELAQAGCKSITEDKPFLNQSNKANLIRLCQTGLYGAIASGIMTDSIPEGSGCPGNDACSSLPGIENGVFIGDSGDLDEIIKAGELEDTEHISGIVRSEAARSDFLELHGIDDTGGMEVHHIVPLSEGGADEPCNMVLISERDHDIITNEHADYYGWHKNG